MGRAPSRSDGRSAADIHLPLWPHPSRHSHALLISPVHAVRMRWRSSLKIMQILSSPTLNAGQLLPREAFLLAFPGITYAFCRWIFITISQWKIPTLEALSWLIGRRESSINFPPKILSTQAFLNWFATASARPDLP